MLGIRVRSETHCSHFEDTQEVHVHKLIRILPFVMAAALMAAIAAGGYAQQPAGAADQKTESTAKKKAVKDQGEYDIFNEALKDQASNPQKEIQDLDTWTQKYPDSDYKYNRLYMYMQAYSRLNPPQPQKVVEYGQQLMGQDLKSIFDDKNGPLTILDILYKVATSVPALPNATQEQIDLARKAAQQLKEQANAYFIPTNKPEKTDEAAWTKAK